MNQALRDMRGEPLNPSILHHLLAERFSEIDFQKAAAEVRVFLHDPRELDLWSKTFFLNLAKQIETG